MDFYKYMSVMSEKVGHVLHEMTGIPVVKVSIQKQTTEIVNFPIAMTIEYASKDNPAAKGLFVMGFINAAMALKVASGVVEKLGMPPLATLNSDANDALGEFLNTVVGHTISAWDKMGMPLLFGPPSKLQKTTMGKMADYRQDSYKITIHLNDRYIDFLVTLSQKVDQMLEEEEGKQTILVVDDSALYRKYISATLEKAGYATISAEDGTRGVEAYKENKPDLTLMDLVMPHMGGLDAMVTIREIDPTAKFIVLTSSQRTDEVVSAKTIGVCDYVLKPMQPQDLIIAIKKVLSQADPPPCGKQAPTPKTQ